MSKTNERHWEVIMNFFEIHPGMATGRINAENGKQKMKSLWEELAMQLNSLGYGAKSSDKWLKTWTDFKYNLKKKASDLKKEQVKTGGGMGGKALHEYELRALQFLGHGFIHGVDSNEVGIKCNPSTSVSSLSKEEDTASPSLLIWPKPLHKTETVENSVNKEKSQSQSLLSFGSYSGINCETYGSEDDKNTPHHSSTSIINSGISTLVFEADPLERSTVPQLGNATVISMDHNYIPQRKKQKTTEDDNMYAETIAVLKDIRDTVDRRLGEIVDVLREKLP